MTGFRLPLRLARREVRRRPGRTALVALLVALPVAGMLLASVTIHTGNHSSLEGWVRSNGQAEAVSYSLDTDAPELPTGSRLVEVTSTYLRARTADGLRSEIQLSDLPLQDPIAVGIHELVEGRTPTAGGEVVLASRLAHRLHVSVGDDLVLVRPALTLRLVGRIDPIGCLSCPSAVVAPGQIPAAVLERDGAGRMGLIDLPTLSAGARDALVASGQVELRNLRDLGPVDDSRSVQWSLVLGAIALTVLGIVISAAFAVGARRQLVTLGQLSASGAPPSTVRAALVLQGTVTGVLGGLLGLAIAGTALLAGRGLFERLLDERIYAYVVSGKDVVLAVAIGVVAASVSALVPARTAARIPTLSALAGRRPLAPVSRRLLMVGVVAMAGGLGLLGLAVVGSHKGANGDLWAFVAILGGLGELLGACVIAPAIAARLEPLAHRLRGSLRLGARSLARNRARTGAVVSAVAAGGALAVAAGALVLGGTANTYEDLTMPKDLVVLSLESYDAQTGEPIDPGLPAPEVAEDAAALLTGARVATVRGTAPGPDFAGSYWTTAPDPRDPLDPRGVAGQLLGQGGVRALVADPALLDAIRAGSDVRSALDETGLVLLTPFGNGRIVVTPPGQTAPLPGRAVHVDYNAGYLSNLLITEAKAEQLAVDLAPVATLLRSPQNITEGQRDGLEDVQYDGSLVPGGDEGAALNVQWAYERSGPTPFQVELMLTGLALVFSVFVVGVSLALAAAESKDERDILTIAGAPPGALARSAGARAWLLAAIGGAMAVPVGFLPVMVFSYASQDAFVDERFPLVFPTRTVLLLVLAVPAVAAAVSFASSATAQLLRPVRVSTATFE